jgi:predicted phage terminase large subunit-like protein
MGKSELISRLLPAYYLDRHPRFYVGLCSYAHDLAGILSRHARQNYERTNPLVADSRAVRRWDTAEGGGMWASGVGGGITGKGFNLGIVDDPVKDRVEAESEVIRERNKDWWESTFYTRREPGAAIVVVQTRWHEDDLSGFLLEKERGGSPERWHIVNFEALKDPPDPPPSANGDRPPRWPEACTLEPDWREPGEPLCPERQSEEDLVHVKALMSEYNFSALYQQRPSPREGGTFKRSWYEIVDPKSVPEEGRLVRFWDHASTEGGGDATAGAKMQQTDGVYYILDIQHFREGPGVRDKLILQTDQADYGAHGHAITFGIEEEPGSAGKTVSLAFKRAHIAFGMRTFADRATGSPETRVDPFASASEIGHVKLVRGPWNTGFLEEVGQWPKGMHDDRVIAVGGCYNKLAGKTPRKVTFGT